MSTDLAVGLAADLACALDPAELARKVGLPPDPWQEEFLRSTESRILLNCARQSGKSTVTALLGVHTAVYEPGALVLLLSPSQRQSQELFLKALEVYHKLEDPPPAKAESAFRLHLENGSRIVSLPSTEQTVRGYSGVSLLAVDEAARVSDDFYFSIRPMLAVSGGRLVALSTPYGTRGWWYDAWRSNEPWQRFRVPAEECPRIRTDFLEEERRTSGEWWFRQEYGCEFLEGETQAFSRDDIDNAFLEKVEIWDL